LFLKANPKFFKKIGKELGVRRALGKAGLLEE
jgi:hypothetical protein